MKHIDPQTLNKAFAHPNAPMFADVIRRLEQDAEMRPSRRRDLISALRRIAQALGRDAENTPADARWLQPRLEKLQPARIGVSPKTLSNMVSNAQAALGSFGIVEPRINRLTDLSPDWLRLWRLALATKNWTLRTSLGRFTYFLNGLGVRPEDVGDDHVLAFRDALSMNRIRKSPDLTCRYAINAWNQAIRFVPEWPRCELTTTDRRKRIKLPADDMPASFHADLELMARTFARPDPLDETGRLTALRPATIQQYRNQLLRFAAHVARSGVPASELTGISCLCDPKTVERGLREMLDGTEGKTNRGIAETAALLRNSPGATAGSPIRTSRPSRASPAASP